MARRRAYENPYYLLDGVIPLDGNNELFDRLLGLATNNLVRPLDAFRPEAPFKPKDHIEAPLRLYPLKAVECKDVAWLAQHAVDADARVGFTNMLEVWGGYRHNNDNSWESTLLRRIEILENPRDRIKDLLKVPEYKDGVHELMQIKRKSAKPPTVGVITGFITCTNMKVNKEAERGTGVGAAVQPVSEEMTGMPGTNLAMQGSLKKTRHKAISGSYNGEVVVACSYLPIIGDFDKPNTPWYNPFPRFKGTSSSQGRVQVGEEPYDVGTETIKGNMRRPLGSGGEVSVDEESVQWEELLESLEDPTDLQFRIGLATSTDLISPESEPDE